MKRNLLNDWKREVVRSSNIFNEENINKSVSIFEELIPKEYFEVEQQGLSKVGNLKSNLSYERWLNFLLCQFNPGPISHLIEISQVLYYFNSPKYKEYLDKLLYTKGKLAKNFFEGNYFELFTAFTFLVNGIETYVEKDDPTVEGDKPLDCYLIIDNEEYLVECKFISSQEKHVKALDGAFHMLEEYIRRRLKILKSSGVNNAELDICGYYVLDDKPSSILSEFSTKLKSHYHKVLTNTLPPQSINFIEPTGLVIEKYIPGLFENYHLQNAKLAIRFKFTSYVAETKFTFIDPAEDIIDRIKKKGISLKKKQHLNSKIKNKIIVIGINNAYNSVPPLSKKFFKENEERFRNRLNDNMTVCFVVKNILSNEPFDVYCYSISKDNPKLENKLNSLNWYHAKKEIE